jgi:hypothetical protein
VAAAGEHASESIGLPSGRNEWRGSGVMEHLEWLKTCEVGVRWDAQLRADAQSRNRKTEENLWTAPAFRED